LISAVPAFERIILNGAILPTSGIALTLGVPSPVANFGAKLPTRPSAMSALGWSDQ
jgi:hypothetical protein